VQDHGLVVQDALLTIAGTTIEDRQDRDRSAIILHGGGYRSAGSVGLMLVGEIYEFW